MSKMVIMGAIPQEIEIFRSKINDGKWYDREVIVEKSKAGKVNAAIATTIAIHKYNPSFLLFTGVCGALDANLSIGDTLIGYAAIDADVDARSFGREGEYRIGQLPFEEKRVYFSNKRLRELGLEFLDTPLVGYIATRDKFVNSLQKREFNEDLSELLRLKGNGKKPNVCDMESSAFLQVADFYKIPALVIRTVSDTLDGDVAEDFNRFISQTVDNYLPLVEHIVKKA